MQNCEWKQVIVCCEDIASLTAHSLVRNAWHFVVVVTRRVTKISRISHRLSKINVYSRLTKRCRLRASRLRD